MARCTCHSSSQGILPLGFIPRSAELGEIHSVIQEEPGRGAAAVPAVPVFQFPLGEQGDFSTPYSLPVLMADPQAAPAHQGTAGMYLELPKKGPNITAGELSQFRRFHPR